MNDKPLKVSDWSQKYKIMIAVFSAATIITLLVKILIVLEQIRNLIQILPLYLCK